MTRLKVPLLSLKAWGTLAAQVTFRRHKSAVDALRTPYPKDAMTALQLAQRLLFQDAVAWWHSLTQGEKEAYDRPGREHHMSGYAWFIRSYLLNPPAATFLALTDTPAAYAGEAGHMPKVNAGETALDWGTIKQYPSGIVDIPSQSRCRAYRGGSTQSIPDDILTKVQLNVETYDEQNEWDPVTNYRFTATIAGYYLAAGNACIVDLADGNKIMVHIQKNGWGVALGRTTTGAIGYAGAAAATVVYLEANDYLELFVLHNFGANRNIPDDETTAGGYTQMAVHKVS